MKKQIKNLLKRNTVGLRFLDAYALLQLGSFIKVNPLSKNFPKVIQLPITNRCNSRCEMCNVWNMDTSGEYSSDEFKEILNDNLFDEVISVGINGGEPTLVSDLDAYANHILNLPKLKYLNIISHGFNTERALRVFKKIYLLCRNKNVKFHISISLDGVGLIHDKVRQIPGGFEKTISTIENILTDQSLYCDTFDVACTVVKSNINYLIELESYCEDKNIPIKYRLGISNKRIESDLLTEAYDVTLDQDTKISVIEFFHGQTIKAKSLTAKFKYFSIFSWLTMDEKTRFLGCDWKNEGATLDSKGNLYYCAVNSEKLGNLRENSGSDIFFSDENLQHRKSIVENSCNNCIHDYGGKTHFQNLIAFSRFILSNRFSIKIYRIRSFFL
ncbi:radical SAM protein [Amylibacter sp.]|nr:radical SAM protein [Amylibacter sp.]